MAGMIEMPPAHMPDHKSVELYLRERGLSAFKDRLFEYGVETVADLLDQEIVTDHALVNDIFMTAKDIEALHAPPQVGRELDYSHLSTNRVSWRVGEHGMVGGFEKKNAHQSVHLIQAVLKRADNVSFSLHRNLK